MRTQYTSEEGNKNTVRNATKEKKDALLERKTNT